MERNRRFASWMGAALGVLTALTLNAVLARASDSDTVIKEEFHHTYPLSATGRVELENMNGAVHIVSWDQNQVKVDAVKRAYGDELLKDAEIRVHPSADSISIETHYIKNVWHENDERRQQASVEYTLTVPRNARLDEIKLINGELDITGVSGEVRASCINGKLVARGLRAQARLATINGHLDANYDLLTTAPIELSSVNGSVELTLPSDVKASIEATTVHGGIDNEFGLHTNDHRFVGHDLRGELGGGGTQIRLNNVNGTIHVRHASDGHSLSPAKDLNRQPRDGI
jgi:DUF4097 and DUF4098 domain-containing protein YvlB